MNTATQIDAYKTTIRASLITAFVGASSLPLEVPRYGFWPLGAYDVGQILQGLLLALCLWRFGRNWSTRTLDACFLFLALAYLVPMWLQPVTELTHGEPVEPMIAHHFMMLALAMLSPSSYKLSVGLILVFAIQALALYAHLRTHGASRSLEREPYFTMMFTGVAIGLQWSSFRRRTLMRELAKSEARAEAHADTSRALLAMRDRANSPLQTIEVGLTVLEHRAPDQNAVVAPLRGALRKLVDVQRGLSALERDAAAHSSQLAPDLDLEHELRRLKGH